MDLSRFQRIRLFHGPTPLEPMKRLSRHLGGPEILIKRDDLLGIGGGGNKVRKLEFLIGEALAGDADTLVTVGALQSNHARLTAACAARLGLGCHLVLGAKMPRHDDAYRQNGNMLLHRLFGARLHIVDAGTDLMAAAQGVAEEVRAGGGRPYVVPLGGSNWVGTLGYADAAREIVDQIAGRNLPRPGTIVTATASGGMHAGIAAGLAALGAGGSLRVLGVNVLSPTASDAARIVTGLAGEAYGRVTAPSGRKGGYDFAAEGAVEVVDGFLGGGYGIPTPEMIDAVSLVARLEGLILDPVYTGKTMAGLLHLVRQGRFASDETIIFLHSGGLPGLFGYQTAFPASETG